ncbi:tetratricopeptide repeat protein [Saccharothrix sp. Mg75]|uniref:tetratricopeptide repeat protein n=1 Tax=Saccharothrix sp. Mg75 TaxID=3445357 RepID=UPI003EE9ADA5
MEPRRAGPVGRGEGDPAPAPAGPAPVGAASNSFDGTGPHARVVQAGVVNGGVHHYGAPAPGTPDEGRFPRRFGRVPLLADAFQVRGTDIGPAGSDPRHHVHVLSGMGGVGKTQLAADYAERVWADRAVDLLVWVTASSREAVVGDFARLAADVTAVEDDDPETGADRLLAWLATTPRSWLVVLDDVQDPADLHDLWPPRTDSGRVLVTTRRRDAALRGNGRLLVDVGLFTPAEAKAYLEVKLADPVAAAGGAGELADALGYLPLALAQAATYLLDRRLTCTEYLERFEDRRRELRGLLPDPRALPDQHRDTVATTWALSVDIADQLQPAGLAAPLLEVMALLDPNGIPVAVLTGPAVLFHLRGVTGDQVTEEQARDALTCLDRLSLITFGPAAPHVEVAVHALVQRAVRDRCPRERLVALSTVAADALLHRWPSVVDAALLRSFRANAAAVRAAAGDGLWQDGRHSLLARAGAELGGSGLVGAACDYFEQLLAEAEHHLGRYHPDTVATLGDLAFWLAEAGRPEAVAAHERWFAALLALRGPNHPETLAALGDLAHHLAEADRATEAADAFRRFLADHTSALGPDHPLTRGRGGDQSTRDVSLSVSTHEALLRVQSTVLSPDDPAVLTTRGRLARWLDKAGDRRAARSAFEALLADRQRVLGHDHPDTLATRNELTFFTGEGLPGEVGDPAGAANALRVLVADQERVQGPRHPDTLATRSNLAFWQRAAGDLTGAVLLLRHLLDDQRDTLGPDHPSTFTTRGHLARWRGEAGDPAGAAADFELLLADRLRALGHEHRSIRTTRSNLVHWRSRAEEDRRTGRAGR